MGGAPILENGPLFHLARRQAATKESKIRWAPRAFSPQLSALRIIDPRNFFAKRKEVTDKDSIRSGAGEALAALAILARARNLW